MTLPIISKKREKLSKLLTCCIPSKKYRKALRGILLFGVRKYKQVIHSDTKTNFKHTLSISAIMKNEGAYIKEWLDYHILVGVQKFYLYDNDSTDNTVEILKPYIDKGIVEYTFFPGKCKQQLAYIDCVNKHAQDTKWMAIIDLDEFLVPVHHKTLIDFLNTLPSNFAQLIVAWVQYGSSGHKHKQPGLLMENYKRHADKSWGIKSIINPRLALKLTNPHQQMVAGFTINEDGKKVGRIHQSAYGLVPHNKLRCNHYVTKSFDEYVARMNQGSATSQLSTEYRSIEKFNWYDRNEIYDDIMDKYIDRLKNK